MVRTANTNVQTTLHLDGKIVASGQPCQNSRIFQNCFSDTETVAVRTPMAIVRTHVPKTPIMTRIRASKAYK
jgi:hypothetical protein